MSTRPPLPKLPLSRLNLPREEEAFINDIVELASGRLDDLVNDVSQTIIDMDMQTGGIALQLALHALNIGVQAKLLEFGAKTQYRKSFIDCEMDERRKLVQEYLGHQKQSALAAYRTEKGKFA